MIPYEVDPSLHTGEPHLPQLDDGFSPPGADNPQPAPDVRHSPSTVSVPPPVNPTFWNKSDF